MLRLVTSTGQEEPRRKQEARIILLGELTLEDGRALRLASRLHGSAERPGVLSPDRMGGTRTKGGLSTRRGGTRNHRSPGGWS